MFERKPLAYGAAIGEAMGAPKTVATFGGKVITGTGQIMESAGKIDKSYRTHVKSKKTGTEGGGSSVSGALN